MVETNLVAEAIAVKRGSDLVFSDLSFSVPSGEALVVTGPNGSGKSTLLRAIAGLLPLAAGSISFNIQPPSPDTRLVSWDAHYFGHKNSMKRDLSVRENLSFWRAFFGVEAAADTIELAAERVGLAHLLDLPFGYLSAGQMRRLAMAKLLVSHRKIWLLDEPTAALDAESEVIFADIVTGHLSEGGTVVAATHQPLGLHTTHQLNISEYKPNDLLETSEAYAL